MVGGSNLLGVAMWHLAESGLVKLLMFMGYGSALTLGCLTFVSLPWQYVTITLAVIVCRLNDLSTKSQLQHLFQSYFDLLWLNALAMPGRHASAALPQTSSRLLCSALSGWHHNFKYISLQSSLIVFIHIIFCLPASFFLAHIPIQCYVSVSLCIHSSNITKILYPSLLDSCDYVFLPVQSALHLCISDSFCPFHTFSFPQTTISKTFDLFLNAALITQASFRVVQ